MSLALAGGTGSMGAPAARLLAARGHEVDGVGRVGPRPGYAPEIAVCFGLSDEADARAARWAGARLVATSRQP